MAERLLTDVIKRDPNNLFRLAALPWTQDNRGETLVRLALYTGDRKVLDLAQQTLSAALEIRQRLASTALDKVDFQLSVIDTQTNIASVEAAMKQLSGDHAGAADAFRGAAVFLLEGYGARTLRRAALLRSIDFLDLATLEYSQANRRDNGRAALKRALEVAGENQAALGNLYGDVVHSLREHFDAIDTRVGPQMRVPAVPNSKELRASPQMQTPG